MAEPPVSSGPSASGPLSATDFGVSLNVFTPAQEKGDGESGEVAAGISQEERANVGASVLRAQITHVKAQLELLVSELDNVEGVGTGKVDSKIGALDGSKKEFLEGKEMETDAETELRRQIPPSSVGRERSRIYAKKKKGFPPQLRPPSRPEHAFDSGLYESLEDDNSTRTPSPSPKNMTPELHYVDWTGFKNTCCDDGFEYAIDVLVGPERFYWQRRREERDIKMGSGSGIYSETETTGEFRNDLDQLMRSQRELPHRIRINSAPLLLILSEIASANWEIKPTVFLRPYKFLVFYENDIRQWCKVLEAKWGSRGDPDSLHQDVEKDTEKRTDYDGRIGEFKNDNLLADEQVSYGSTADAGGHIPPRIEKYELEEPTSSLEALQGLRCLIQFIDKEITPAVERYRASSSGKILFRDLWYLYKPGDEVISTQDLDNRTAADSSFGVTIVEPDEVTISSRRSSGKAPPAIWKVLQMSMGRPLLSAPTSSRDSEMMGPQSQAINPFKILCYKIGYDGDVFGPIGHVFEIPPFDGEKDIESLDPVPARFSTNYKHVRDKLLAQGRKFMTYTSPTHQFYVGLTLTCHPGGLLCRPARKSAHIEGNIIVDFKEAARTDRHWVRKLRIPDKLSSFGAEIREDYPISIWKDKVSKLLHGTATEKIYDDSHIDRGAMEDFISKDSFMSAFRNRLNDEDVDGKAFTDDELVLLPDRVCGFDLHRRTFAILSLNGLRPVKVKNEGWADLKLPRGHKRMVQAQVKTHFREKRLREHNQQAALDYDLVHGKGQGLIILLHGAPGVGKTSTAECVAESLRKPLYPITCGDLGVSAKEVEATLTETFSKAEAWDCVLLLDEADVFLAQRTRTDLKRNAIVSVFLRVLEYYKGILILTTNRVGAFDEAFKSRIHLHLYYPVLNKEQTMSIWRMNLDRTNKSRGSNMIVDEEEIMRFAEGHFEYHKRQSTRWNGRQIRNAFQTAAALAEYEAFEELEKKSMSVDSEWEEPDEPVRAHLKVSHFKTVADASSQFDAYITEAVGFNDAERALMDRDRADNFKWAASRQQDFGSFLPTFQQQNAFPQPPNAGFEEFSQQHYFKDFRNSAPSPIPSRAMGTNYMGSEDSVSGDPRDQYSRRREYGAPWLPNQTQSLGAGGVNTTRPLGQDQLASSFLQQGQEKLSVADDGY